MSDLTGIERDTTFRQAIAIIEALNSAGFPAMLAGGCVRDRQFGIAPKDFDIACTAQPKQSQWILEGKGYKTIPTGIEHGTITVITGCGHFEVTSLRQDIASDGRHAQVAFSQNFAQDSARRDFTINALFEDYLGHIYDFHDGLNDLKARRLRFIGKSAERIREDYLRILRFFRFWARFDLEIDPVDLITIEQLKDGLQRISRERITSELLQILACTSPGRAVAAMQDCDLLIYLLPEGFRAARGGTREHFMKVLDGIAIKDTSYRALARLAIFMHYHHEKDAEFYQGQPAAAKLDSRDAGDSREGRKSKKASHWEDLIREYFRISRQQARIVTALLLLPSKLAKANRQSDYVDVLCWLNELLGESDCYAGYLRPILAAYHSAEVDAAKIHLEKICAEKKHLMGSMPISPTQVLTMPGVQLTGRQVGQALAYLTQTYRNSEWSEHAEGMRLLAAWQASAKK